MNTKEEMMLEKLYKKMYLEYKRFLTELRICPVSKIIESSYEKVIKEDILVSVEGGDLSYEQTKALYLLKEPLAELYMEWLNNDYTNMENIRATIEEKAEKEVKWNKEKKQQKER